MKEQETTSDPPLISLKVIAFQPDSRDKDEDVTMKKRHHEEEAWGKKIICSQDAKVCLVQFVHGLEHNLFNISKRLPTHFQSRNFQFNFDIDIYAYFFSSLEMSFPKMLLKKAKPNMLLLCSTQHVRQHLQCEG